MKLKKFQNGLDKLLTLWYNKREEREGHPTNQKGIDTMTNKMTYSDALRNAIATVTDEATKSRLEDLLVSIEKRSNSERKPSKAQLEKKNANEQLADKLFNALANWGAPVTVAEIKTLDNAFVELSSPKLTALLKILMDQNKVTKIEGKRVATYQALA